MLLPLFLLPIITLLILSIFWFLNQNILQLEKYKNKILIYRSIVYDLFKLVTLISLSINLFYSTYLWKFYPIFLEQNNIYLYQASINIGEVTIFELNHNINLPFILLSNLILIIAFLTNWYSIINVYFFSLLILFLEFFLIGAFSSANIFIFLLFFEASALPVFILIAYCGSSRRERIKAGYYFLFFTLYGSLSLLLLILNFYNLNQISFLNDQFIQSSNYILWILLFVAFAVKIPLFPFHIWLPYAHVEASTSTSILLAALMLKLGGYGVIKFMLPLFTIQTHLYFRPLSLFICSFGVIYGSLCALRQIDLKRQIAFSSISHMSFSTIGIFTFTEIGIKGSIYLMLSHGLTSAALFFLVGILSERYHTRSIMAFSGLISSMPLFSFFFIFTSLANIGFPGTSGFLPEFFILISILAAAPFILLPIIIGMFFTTISTLIVLLRLLFGHLKYFYFKSSWTDLNFLDFFILSILSFLILFLGLYDILFWI